MTFRRTVFAFAGWCTTLAVAAPTYAAELPCAPVLDRSLTQRPIAPANLRIVGGDADLDEHSAVSGSGPFVNEAIGTTGAISPHSYFERLSNRPDCLVAYSLRDPDQLVFYRTSNSKPQTVTYDPANDPDPRRQDAAKVVIPATDVSLPNQVRLPIPPPGNSSLLVTWDAWWGREFRFDHSGIGNYKAFQLASPKDRIWTEVRSRFAQAEGSSLAAVDVRSYGQLGISLGPNVTNNLPLSPQRAQFGITAEVWTRYWAYFRPAGEWYEFSLWVADENRDPVLLIDRLLLKPHENSTTGWEAFWLEYNTSTNGIPAGRGPLVAYARNVVMLRGISDVRTVLERPVR